MRLSNIYDIEQDTKSTMLLLKFHRNEEKYQLLLESGIRMHLTEYTRDKQGSPSNFNAKLRKHLKSKRLTGLAQIDNGDRKVDFTFGEDEFAHHLIVEFFATGNIILTDHEYKILSLMRVVEINSSDGTEANTLIAVGQIYKLYDQGIHEANEAGDSQILSRQQDMPISSQILRRALLSATAIKDDESPTIPATSSITTSFPSKSKSSGGGKSKKWTKKKSITLKNVLRTALGLRYGPALVDHAIALSSVSPDLTDFTPLLNKGEQVGVEDGVDDNGAGADSAEFESLLLGFKASDDILSSYQLASSLDVSKGYIITAKFQPPKHIKSAGQSNGLEEEGDELASPEYVFDEFHPFKPAYFQETEKSQILEFPSFDRAVDEFYSKIESQKLQQRARQAQAHALKKLEQVKESSATQIQNFILSQEEKEICALTIELNLSAVDAAIQTICGFVASGMDWGDLEELVREEREKGNPLALLIKNLKLDVGMIRLCLPHPNFMEEDEDSDFKGDSTDEDEDHDRKKKKSFFRKEKKTVLVDVNIYETAYSNARSYYGAKKLAVEKGKKTIEASHRQLEIAEKKILASLEKVEAKAPTIAKYRSPYWFEKFLWFISSENFLVVGGRDASQAELLVTKYMGSEDFYVNADIEKSSCVIVKKMDKNAPHYPPPTTLLQAGTMAICQSKAWESKILTSAFWVPHNQVSKISLVAGDPLPPGVFHIKGKKNYLPPIQLVYGVGLLFMVADECVEPHLLERRPWARNAEGGDVGIDETKFQDAELNIEEEDINQAAVEIMESAKTASPPRELEEEDDKQEIAASPTPDPPIEEDSGAIADKDAKLDRINDLSLDDKQEEEKSSTASSPSLTTTKKNGPVARGQKSRLKKINSKYADQDEEDRQLALALLGSNKGPQPKGKKAKALVEKQRQQEERTKAEKLKWEARQKEKEKKDGQGQDRIGKRSSSTGAGGVESTPVGEDLSLRETNLDNLTGIPRPTDKLLHCIPVCAPWSVLQKYKYKAKLLPGSQKRGKGAKSAESFFLAQAQPLSSKGKKPQLDKESVPGSVDGQSSEADLIKLIPEPEWINAMLSKVKVVASK